MLFSTSTATEQGLMSNRRVLVTGPSKEIDPLICFSCHCKCRNANNTNMGLCLSKSQTSPTFPTMLQSLLLRCKIYLMLVSHLNLHIIQNERSILEIKELLAKDIYIYIYSR